MKWGDMNRPVWAICPVLRQELLLLFSNSGDIARREKEVPDEEESFAVNGRYIA